MSSEGNKELVRRFCDAFTRQDAAALKEVMSAELAERWIKAIASNDAIWTDHRAEVTDMMADGDKVWALLATSGRHTGEWNGLPATGNAWTNRVAAFCRVAGGKIVELRAIPDVHNVAKQLGGVVKVVPQ